MWVLWVGLIVMMSHYKVSEKIQWPVVIVFLVSWYFTNRYLDTKKKPKEKKEEEK